MLYIPPLAVLNRDGRSGQLLYLYRDPRCDVHLPLQPSNAAEHNEYRRGRNVLTLSLYR